MHLPGVTALRDAVLGGELRAVDAIEAALSRTDPLIGAEGIGAFLSVQATRARQEAAAVDARIAAGERPPMAGVPVALSDELADAGHPLAAACPRLRGDPATETAPAVIRLRRAGACILGRTNLDALGLGTSTEASGFHTTLNPWDIDRVPGGRGGAAAAVAMGAVVVALGSDLAGELRQAAAFCGVAALRPTPGPDLARGAWTLAPSWLTIGSIAATCKALGATPIADAGPPERGVDLAGVTVGIVMETMGRHSTAPVKAAVNSALATLEDAQVRLRPVAVPSLPAAAGALLDLIAVECEANARHHPALAGSDEPALLPWRRRARSLTGDADGRRRLAASRRVADRVRAELLAALAEVDVLATPTTPDVAFRFGEHADDLEGAWGSLRWTAGASVAGLPALSVPVGLADLGLGDHMPAGLQLVGAAGRDDLLLALGAHVEAALGPPPQPPKGIRW